MRNVFGSIHSVKHGLSKTYLAAYIPQNVVYPKCVWQRTFRKTWLMRNVFDSEHSVGVGADLSCPYQRNCKKICCVVRWFHSAIIVGSDEEASAMNRSPTPDGVHVERYCTTQVNSAEMDADAFIDAHSTRHIY